MIPTRDELLAGWERKGRDDSLVLYAISSRRGEEVDGPVAAFAQAAFAQACGFRLLRGLGTRGVGARSLSPKAGDCSPGAARAEPPASSPEGGGSRVLHIGGPRDGEASTLPTTGCPCCGRALESGVIVRYRDGSRYLLDVERGRAVYVTPALLGSEG